MNTPGRLLCLALLALSGDAAARGSHGGNAPIVPLSPVSPPTTAAFTVCTNAGNAPMVPNGTDNSPGTYWWTGGNIYVMTTDGTGYWYLSHKPAYAPTTGLMWPLTSETLPTFTGITPHVPTRWTHGFTATPPGTVQANTDSITISATPGSHIWQHARHVWPTSVLALNGVLYGFYHEEAGTCPQAGPITCTSNANCTFGAGGAYGQCYWESYTGLADPGAGNGYCMLKTGGRSGLAISTNNGATWTDRGRLVNAALDPDYCAATTGVDWSGGVEFPVALVDADGWVYVTFSNLSGDPANVSSKLNQGTLIARISQSDLVAGNMSNLNFYDAVNQTWNFSTQSTNVALFRTNVQPFNYPANAMSWGVPGPYGTPIGNFSIGGFSYNTTLQTYVLAASNFIKNTGGTNSPSLYYFKGASLATDPLNWVPFDSYIDSGGVSHTTGSAGISPVTGAADNCDYYWQMTGPGPANALCVAAQGSGMDGVETEKCFGLRADWASKKNLQCASPAGNATATMYVKFARNVASSACP